MLLVAVFGKIQILTAHSVYHPCVWSDAAGLRDSGRAQANLQRQVKIITETASSIQDCQQFYCT